MKPTWGLLTPQSSRVVSIGCLLACSRQPANLCRRQGRLHVSHALSGFARLTVFLVHVHGQMERCAVGLLGRAGWMHHLAASLPWVPLLYLIHRHCCHVGQLSIVILVPVCAAKGMSGFMDCAPACGRGSVVETGRVTFAHAGPYMKTACRTLYEDHKALGMPCTR